MSERLYPHHQHTASWHNVVGPGGVLRTVSPEMAAIVGNHYSPRSYDHLPPGEAETILVDGKPTIEVLEQLEYRAATIGAKPVNVLKIDGVAAIFGSKALVVPYIRLPQTEEMLGASATIYGLPGELTARLKNKADSHRLMRDWPETREMIPNHIVCQSNEIGARGLSMIRAITEMYQEAGMDDYPPGIMIRGAESDGGYGSGFIRQHGARIVFYPDGKQPLDPRGYESWTEALKAVQEHICNSMDTNQEPRVVMTRLLDLQASPGISTVIIKGRPHALPWNGQWKEPGETACTGTCSIGLETDPVTIQARVRFEEQTQATINIVAQKALANRPDLADIYAMMNMDFMIVGPHETRLWQAVNASPELRKKYLHIADNNQYSPRACDPSSPLIAEINPRITNWTGALMAVMRASGRESTIGNFRDVAGLNGVQILARDHWPIPAQMSMHRVRSVLTELNYQLKGQDSGFILRMPDSPHSGTIGFGPDIQMVYQMAHNALFGSQA